jgi:hypothetical protein
MTEQQVRDFLAQFDQAREDFKTWPQWMQDAAVERAASFPMPPKDGVAPTVEVIGYIHKEWEPSQGQGRIYGHQPGPDYKAVTAAAGVDLPDGAKR